MFEGLFNFANLSNHLVQIGVYALLALSLNLINGSLGAFSLGHHAFYGMGAYAAGATLLAFGSHEGGLVVFAASFVAAAVAAGLFGLIVGAPCLRLKGDYLAIATLGFGEIFNICVQNSGDWTIFGERGLGGTAGFSPSDGFARDAAHPNSHFNDVMLGLAGPTGRRVVYLLLAWATVILAYVFIRNIIRSGHGRAILAIRDDETAAELMGVRLFPHKVMVFVIGAALAGVAGAMMVNFLPSVTPKQFEMMVGVKILLMVVLGGLGSMSGAVLAAVVLYVSEQALGIIDLRLPFLGFSTDGFSLVYKPVKDLWQVLFALLLMVLMVAWPSGLTGGREFSRAFFADLAASWKARIVRWFSRPGWTALGVLRWVQLFVALPLSEHLAKETPGRLLFMGGAVAFFVACGVLRKHAMKPLPSGDPA